MTTELQDIKLVLSTLKRDLQDIKTYLYTTDGIVLQDIKTYLYTTNGTVLQDIKLCLKTVMVNPTYNTVVAQRLSSVLSEV